MKKEKWKRKLHALLVVLTIIATVLLLIFIFKKKYMWIFLPITVLTILEKTNEIYGSLTIIKNTISQKKGVEALSKRETDAIIMLASALMMFNLYKIPQIIISYVMGLSKKIISDWLTIIILTMTVTLYCFLIGVLLLIPLKGIICLARYINQKIYLKKKLKIEKIYTNIRYKLVLREFISIDFVEWTLKKKKVMRILWIFLFVIIPIDAILKIVVIGLYIIITIGLYVNFIWCRIKKSVECLVKWFENIAERKIVNVIFRSAFVLSISMVVIVNRYNPFLHYIEASSGVLEFIASAIVIPMILTWIIDYKASVHTEK